MFLITGANGQLGRCLRDMLGENGALYTDAAELDMTDLQAVQAFGAEHHFSAIINCAAYTNVDKSEEEPALARRINVTGTENLAKLAAARHVPLVHISTDYVFDGTAHTPIPEDAPARPTGVYGPYEKDYYLMMKSIKYGFDFIVGFKPQLITFIYVKDLVQAIFKAIDRGVTRRGYFLSEGAAYTSSQFRRYVAAALGKRWVIPVKIPIAGLWLVSVVAEKAAALLGKTSTLNRDKFRIMKQRNWICDISNAQTELGFVPQYSLERGVNECVKWYRENHWL